MYQIVFKKQYKKQYKRIRRSGQYDIQQLKAIAILLKEGKPLPEHYRDHKLHREYEGCRECHLAPDWLLIYRVNEEEKIIELHSLGSHSELF